jgi:putative FmdB family regulatory protein
MPIYEFYCKRCQGNFESLMKPYDPVRCPECGGVECEKQITAHSSYSIQGDNSASVTPKSRATVIATDKKLAKDERVKKIVDKQLADFT